MLKQNLYKKSILSVLLVGILFLSVLLSNDKAYAATALTSAQIDQAIAKGYPSSQRSSINNVWQAYNNECNYSTISFNDFLYFIATFKTITDKSQCPSKASSYARAVYLEVSNMTNRKLDCDAVFDCMYNRVNGMNVSWDTAFASLDGLNSSSSNYWHQIMKDPFSDCAWSLNASEALVKAYNNCLRVQDGSYSKLTTLPNGYYYFNETPGTGRIQIGDFYFRKTF
jgi:hypothetical protein